MIDILKIKEALPHRYPMLLVDRVLEVSEDEIVALKNVTINEPFFNGHFPDYPVMPGVLIMEALAQTAGVLELSKEENKGNLVFYAGMDKVKFKKRLWGRAKRVRPRETCSAQPSVHTALDTAYLASRTPHSGAIDPTP